MDKKSIEHYLLDIYSSKGIYSRWFLTGLSFYALDRVQNNQSWTNLNEAQKLGAKCFLQLDIISKMMMYSEDIAIFSWAFSNDKSFYEILDDKNNDLGKVIEKFYGNVDQLSNKDIYKIMSFMPEEDIAGYDEKVKELIIRNMRASAIEIKRILGAVGSFGKTNHPFYKRYKHGALPIEFNNKIKFQEPYMQDSETYNIAYIEKEPFSKPRVIPFSDKVIESYRILWEDMNKLLQAMIPHRISSLERDLSGILPQSGFEKTVFTSEEYTLLKKVTREYYKINEPKLFQNFERSNILIDREDYEWYANLDNFLAECKQR